MAEVFDVFPQVWHAKYAFVGDSHLRLPGGKRYVWWRDRKTKQLVLTKSQVAMSELRAHPGMETA